MIVNAVFNNILRYFQVYSVNAIDDLFFFFAILLPTFNCFLYIIQIDLGTSLLTKVPPCYTPD